MLLRVDSRKLPWETLRVSGQPHVVVPAQVERDIETCESFLRDNSPPSQSIGVSWSITIQLRVVFAGEMQPNLLFLKLKPGIKCSQDFRSGIDCSLGDEFHPRINISERASTSETSCTGNMSGTSGAPVEGSPSGLRRMAAYMLNSLSSPRKSHPNLQHVWEERRESVQSMLGSSHQPRMQRDPSKGMDEEKRARVHQLINERRKKLGLQNNPGNIPFRFSFPVFSLSFPHAY